MGIELGFIAQSACGLLAMLVAKLCRLLVENIIIIIIFFHGLGRLTCSGIDAL